MFVASKTRHNQKDSKDRQKNATAFSSGHMSSPIMVVQAQVAALKLETTLRILHPYTFFCLCKGARPNKKFPSFVPTQFLTLFQRLSDAPGQLKIRHERNSLITPPHSLCLYVLSEQSQFSATSVFGLPVERAPKNSNEKSCHFLMNKLQYSSCIR